MLLILLSVLCCEKLFIKSPQIFMKSQKVNLWKATKTNSNTATKKSLNLKKEQQKLQEVFNDVVRCKTQNDQILKESEVNNPVMDFIRQLGEGIQTFENLDAISCESKKSGNSNTEQLVDSSEIKGGCIMVSTSHAENKDHKDEGQVNKSAEEQYEQEYPHRSLTQIIECNEDFYTSRNLIAMPLLAKTVPSLSLNISELKKEHRQVIRFVTMSLKCFEQEIQEKVELMRDFIKRQKKKGEKSDKSEKFPEKVIAEQKQIISNLQLKILGLESEILKKQVDYSRLEKKNKSDEEAYNELKAFMEEELVEKERKRKRKMQVWQKEAQKDVKADKIRVYEEQILILETKLEEISKNVINSRVEKEEALRAEKEKLEEELQVVELKQVELNQRERELEDILGKLEEERDLLTLKSEELDKQKQGLMSLERMLEEKVEEIERADNQLQEAYVHFQKMREQFYQESENARIQNEEIMKYHRSTVYDRSHEHQKFSIENLHHPTRNPDNVHMARSQEFLAGRKDYQCRRTDFYNDLKRNSRVNRKNYQTYHNARGSPIKREDNYFTDRNLRMQKLTREKTRKKLSIVEKLSSPSNKMTNNYRKLNEVEDKLQKLRSEIKRELKSIKN